MAEPQYRIVVRATSSQLPTFNWLLYFGPDPQPVKRSHQVYATEAAAKAAGEKNLAEFLRLTALGR
jgi:hypothetical protein